MSPRKVDKNQRRKEIALASESLLHKGIRNITVEQVAKNAGIGKGTIYEYFSSKEDIIFEMINLHIEDYHKEFIQLIQNAKSSKEKLMIFFKFVIDDSEEIQEHFKGYQDYLSVVLSDDNKEMKNFNCSCNEFFTAQIKEILEEGISSGELIPQAIDFIEGIICFEKGVVLRKMAQENFDAKKVCEDFLNSFFNLLEKKND